MPPWYLTAMAPDGLDALPAFAAEAFLRRWGPPTAAQALAWPALARGEHALVVAPTGSGKTLAAFYGFLARLVQASAERPGVELVYVSPLKALAADVEKNLRAPLAVLREEARRQGLEPAPVPVAVRTGDTPARERAAMRRHPPRVLVTTPESLYLLLASPRTRELLSTARAVIVDEVHALLPSKRGVHLSLTLERLEALCAAPPQRVGLTATIRPAEAAARWLAGFDAAGEPRPVAVLDAGGRKEMDLRVVSPGEAAALGPGPMWPRVAEQLVELIRAHRSTLVFCNNRRLAERMTALVNAVAGGPLALAHHGSMSRERRQAIEERLKAGELEALVATSSLELGIDVGAIDLVVQLQSPKSVARGLQRVGRSGHLVGATAKGRILGTFRGELVEAAAIARAMRARRIEPVRAPERCLDVLAQQLAAEVAGRDDATPLRELWEVVRRAAPYRALAWEELLAVVDMLAGRYAATALRDARPRLHWDRRRGKVGPLPGTRAIATARPGAIPDRGLYRVELEETRARVGELDEEFVHESRVGDAFVLGASTWKIVRILEDRVVVRPGAPGEPARMPFWRGEGLGRPYALGLEVGALLRDLQERLPDRAGAEAFAGEACALDAASAAGLVEHVARQAAAGAVPDDRMIVVEQFEDDEGEARVALLSPFGGRVHAAWGIAIQAEARRRLGVDVPFAPADDGILFRAPPGDAAERLLGCARWLRSAEVGERLSEEIEATPLYAGLFREAAQRALIFGGARGRRAPLWLARLRAADLEQLLCGHPDFPVAREARREALEDVLDVRALAEVLAGIERGEIQVAELRRSLPSPFASQLVAGFTARFLYEGDAPRLERRARALAAGRDAAGLLLAPEELEELIEPEAAAAVEARRQHTAPGTRARTPEELAEILRRVGDLRDEELAARYEGDAAAAIAALARAGRAVRMGGRWILDEDLELWGGATGGRAEIVRRFAAARGPFTTEDVAARYGFDVAEVEALLAGLERDGVVARGRFVRAGGRAQWCDRRNLAEVHRRTLALLRDRGAPARAPQFAAYLLARQRAGDVAGAAALLAGARVPLETLERDLFGRRVPRYAPEKLDAACAAGEVVWWLDGGKVAIAPRADAAAWLPPAPPDEELAPDERIVLAALDARGAQFGAELLGTTRLPAAALFRALWSLARRGLVTNDAYEAVRRAAALDFAPSSAEVDVATSVDALRRLRHTRPSPWVGRFARLRPEPLPAEERLRAHAFGLLERYGIVGKPVADVEPGAAPWSELEAVYHELELRGEIVRGSFVEGLGGYQVALAAAVDDLRAPRDPAALELVNACDPANPYGGLLAAADTRVARVPSTYLVLRGGAPLLVVEAYGRRVTPLAEASEDVLRAALATLRALLVLPARLRPVRSLVVHTYAGREAAAAAHLFAPAGFQRDADRMVMGVLDAERAARESRDSA